MSYIGSPLIFQFDTISRNVGCIEGNSIAQYSGTSYFLSDDGFYATNGQTLNGIGSEKVDRYFFNNANIADIDSISAAVDPERNLVIWNYTNVSGGRSLLIYNFETQKWCEADTDVDYLSTLATSGATLDGLDSAYNVTAGSFVIGQQYTIRSVGTTDYTLIGAVANTVGVLFTATGVGSGTGVAIDMAASAAALKNPEPTPLQTAALNRARASVAASEEIRQQARIQSQQKPTIAPGPAQDLARSMETLRRGMIVEPSEPLPVLPSIQQMRAGFVTDVDPDELKKMTKAERVQLLGPVVSASDVYTGAAAEAAGPVIFTGKSKANSVLAAPPITGSIGTPTGRYLTQDNPDVLGTVYNVAGTPANRAISRQVEANAQAFLADAITGGMQAKAISDPESYVTPRGSVMIRTLRLLSNRLANLSV